jgi:hypothetical protein
MVVYDVPLAAMHCLTEIEKNEFRWAPTTSVKRWSHEVDHGTIR